MTRFSDCLLLRLFSFWLICFTGFGTYSQIPTSGLIAYYPFTGNAADSSGLNRHGNVTGATLTTDRFGRANQAYFFDRDGDKIVINNWEQLLQNTPRSISLWFKSSHLNSSSYCISWGMDAPNQFSIIGNWYNNSENYFGFFANNNETHINPNSYFDEGWHHVLMTHDGATTKLYIDGILRKTKNTSYDTAKSPLIIGSFMGVSSFFHGAIDDIRIYSRGLSEAEAQAVYTGEAPKTVVGYTAVDVNVGESGDARAGISINVPKGTSIQPTLQLVYNSQGGNGLQGLGWSLDGVFQSITRLSATIAQDGFADPVDFDETDRFALNGERLMVINGVYGADGAEYRTEQNSFSKIISYGTTGKGPEKFKVWTKDGLILEFAYTADSRIETSGSSSEVIMWLLNRMEDKKGNFLTLSYEEDNTKNEFRPIRIDYTGNTFTGLQPYNTVKFIYEDRPDFYSKRLSVIEAYDHTTLFRKYVLDYEATSLISQLITITEYGTNGAAAFKSTNIHWTPLPPVAGFNKPGSGTWTTPSMGHTFHGDFNADGLTDIIGHDNATNTFGLMCTSNGKRFDTAKWTIDNHDWSTGFRGDFNTDGKIDLALPTASGLKVCLSNGINGFSCSLWNNVNVTGQITVGDFNADGRTDVTGKNQTTNQYQLYISTGTGFTAYPFPEFPTFRSYVVGDFTGDGKTDIYGIINEGGTPLTAYRMLIAENNSFRTELWPSGANYFSLNNRMQGDYNGDGRLDLAYSADINYGSWNILYSDGKTFRPGILQGSWFSQGRASRAFTVDLNGDGLSDLVGHDNNYNWTAAYSRGSTTEQMSFASPSIPINQPVVWADFDGDGTTDWGLKTSPTQWSINFSNINRHLVTQITTGHGATYKFEYSPLTDKNVYTRTDTATYPNADFIGSVYVVKQVSTDDGTGQRQKVAYRYKGGTLNLQGRGFLGYTIGEVIDSTAKITTRTVYVRDPRLRAARVKSMERRTFDGKLLQSTEYEPAFTNQGNGVYFSYYKTTTERSYELNGVETGRKKTEQTFDSYGNALEIKITYKNGYQLVTSNEYLNDPGNWRLGRLTSTVVNKIRAGKPTVTKNSSFGYDTDGYLIRETLLPLHPTLRIQTDYTLNPYGNTTSSTISGPNIVPRTDLTTYDSENRFALSTANALGHTSTLLYENGYLKTATDPNQLSVSYERDAMGRETKVIYPDGTFKTTQYKFCESGSMCPAGVVHFIQEEMAGKGISRTYIDSLDRIKRTEKQGFDGRKIWVDYQYNKLGQKTGESDEYYEGDTPQWHTTEFDILQRSTRQTSPGNRTATNEYTTLAYRGEILSVTKSVNFEQQNVWEAEDELGKKIFTVNHLGDTLWFEYDNDFNVIATQDPKGNRITATYNIRGFKTSMSDPDMGTYTYEHNALGLLTRQINPDNQIAVSEYNVLDEQIKRTEPEGVSTWEYHTGQKAIGKLSKVYLNSQPLEVHTFDGLGRPASTTYYREGESYTYNYAYHATLGYLEEEKYPGNNLTVKYLYNSYGYLNEVRNKANNTLFWKANVLDANNRVTAEQLGNGLITNRYYNPLTGALERIRTGTSAQNEKHQDYRYSYSALGNLLSRQEYFEGQLGNRSETFEYDKLNRLTKTTGPLTVSQTYDALGNITYKSDVGYYKYGENGTGPHVLTSIDHRGINVNSTLGACTYPFNQGIQLTSYNYVSLLSNQQGDSIKFTYGAGRERIVQTVIKGGKPKWRKHYAGGKFEKLRYSSQYFDEVYYIQAGGAVIAFVEKTLRRESGSVTKTHYIHSDHLGSMSILTDQSGNVERRMSHDAWGRAREATTWQPYAAPPELPASQRGFTFHEMLDMDWLICMNARIYDPISGRFLTPDPIIQFPDDLQSYNRYAYTGNNPLSFVDPSGHSFLGGIKKFFKKYIGTIVGIAVAVFLPPLLGAALYIQATATIAAHLTLAGAFVTGIASGFAGSFVGALANGAGFGGAIQAGLQGGVWGGLTATVTFGIGSVFGKEGLLSNAKFLKPVTHGVTQGLFSKAQGGAFSGGFWAGFAGDIAGGAMPQGNITIAKTIISATIGGTVSDLTGGDFGNGAISASFVYLFNHAQHQEGNSNTSDSNNSDQIAKATSIGGNSLEIYKEFLEGINKWGITNIDKYDGKALGKLTKGIGYIGFALNLPSIFNDFKTEPLKATFYMGINVGTSYVTRSSTVGIIAEAGAKKINLYEKTINTVQKGYNRMSLYFSPMRGPYREEPLLLNRSYAMK
ncbi:LamG-like jellyroll fold domain-containing protein [Runella aurantiaca]|uniref:Insecticide toxin TcdB middle/N-terminal domain-containing protein n=1 Tax=Runella aurantiaca TaxID=2282308 RepID=A0A369IDK0_9BACT|nr:LamG-like jellyroll fold domain-containing protein [Runella aurantiaca]RDB07849.1 hypothetical protein DVG78_02000 [Runella aurantiaca]